MATVHSSYENTFLLQPIGQSLRAFGRRKSLIVMLSTLACSLFLILLSLINTIEDLRKIAIYYAAALVPPVPDFARPPAYTEIRKWESNLPQHNFDLPYPEGKFGRYVLFSNSRTHLSGWNNKLNDM